MSVQRLTINIGVPRAVHEMLLPALVARLENTYILKIAFTYARRHLQQIAQHTRINGFLRLFSSEIRQVFFFIVAVCTYKLELIW